MDKKKARGNHNEFPLRDEMTMTGTVSATDCTGLVPAGSIDSAEEAETAASLGTVENPMCPGTSGDRHRKGIVS